MYSSISTYNHDAHFYQPSSNLGRLNEWIEVRGARRISQMEREREREAQRNHGTVGNRGKGGYVCGTWEREEGKGEGFDPTKSVLLRDNEVKGVGRRRQQIAMQVPQSAKTVQHQHQQPILIQNHTSQHRILSHPPPMQLAYITQPILRQPLRKISITANNSDIQGRHEGVPVFPVPIPSPIPLVQQSLRNRPKTEQIATQSVGPTELPELQEKDSIIEKLPTFQRKWSSDDGKNNSLSREYYDAVDRNVFQYAMQSAKETPKPSSAVMQVGNQPPSPSFPITKPPSIIHLPKPPTSQIPTNSKSPCSPLFPILLLLILLPSLLLIFQLIK